MSKRTFSSADWEIISLKSDPGFQKHKKQSLSSQKAEIRSNIKLKINKKFAIWKSENEVSLEYLKAMKLTVKDFQLVVLNSEEYKTAIQKAEIAVFGL